MQLPYQCMTRCGDILVAARGSSIDAFKLQDGSLLSTWTDSARQNFQAGNSLELAAEPTTKLATQSSKSSSTIDITLETTSPPAKKRKLSLPDQSPLQPEAKNGKRKQNNRSSAVASGMDAPAITVLVSTTDGRHVIAVTGEDKSIRVFENVIDGVHRLKQISQRNMPKRPCTLLLTNDNSTIISADKFGDVYSLPLLPSEPSAETQPGTREHTSLSKPFVPAANELTIHSQRNRRALENQKKHGNKASEKSEPSFEHKLLLGHVSMLTDIALVTFEKKNYVFTADRDEHIRISRGIPQTHIIEGFCLGHTEFISRLCIPESRPNILISGGGNDEIFVWEWKLFKVASRTNISKHVKALRLKLTEPIARLSEETTRIAISGLYHTREYVNKCPKDYIILTCEGVPAIFLFDLCLDDNSLRHIQTYELPGNPLVVTTSVSLPIQGSVNDLVVSIDTVHRPGSTTEVHNEEAKTERLLGIQFKHNVLIGRYGIFNEPVDEAVDISHKSGSIGQLSNLLYNLENLRKRDGDGQDE